MTDLSRPRLRMLALLAPFAAAGVLGLLRTVVDPAPAALVLVLVVVAVAAWGDRPAGVVAALSASLGFDLFLTAPYLSLAIADPQDVELTVALVLVGLAVSEIALRGLGARSAAVRRQGYLDGVSALLDLPGEATGDDRGEALARAVARVVGVDHVRWVPGAPDRRDAVVGPAGELLVDGRATDPLRHGLPVDRVTAVPVAEGDTVVGHLELTAASRVVRPSREQLWVAALLARLVAHPQPGAAHDAPRGRAG